MSIIPISYQAVMLESQQTNTVNTGTNLIQNGKFDSDLSSWGPVNYVWSAGTAAYEWSTGCYIGQIEQVVPLQAGKRYRLRFKYKATKEFNINLKIRDFDADEDLVPEQTFPANDNGNWHYYTIFINCLADVDALIQFLNKTTVDGVDVSCDPDGKEDGFYLDDVTLYEQTKSYSCGACDEVIMDFNRPVEFQMKTDESSLENLSAFSGNPFNKITSTDLTFTFNGAFTAGQRTTIYCCGKIFIFKAGSSYSVNVVNNIYEIILDGSWLGSDIMTGLKDAIVANIDAVCGTTTTFVLGVPSTYTIANIPENSYIDNSLGFFTSVATVASSPITSYGFHYENNNICYLDYGTKYTTFQYMFSKVLTSGKRYKFSLLINSSFTDFTGVIKVDDGSNPVQSFPVTIPYGSNTVKITFTTLSTGSHDIRLEITDTAEHNSGICIDVESISLVSYSAEDLIDKIETIDCAGNTAEVPFNSNVSNQNILIQINNSDFPISTPYRIVVTDSDGNVFISQSIRLIDFDTYAWCKRKKLIKINWTHSCKFGDIDYSGLPFINEVYIKGFIQMAPPDKKDRIQMVNANTGGSSTVYDRTVEKAELRTGLYSPATQEMLSRAFQHNNLTVDDIGYYLDESGTYTPNPIGNGYYNARVDLVKGGGGLIIGGCCS